MVLDSFERGQRVSVGGRGAVFVETHYFGAAIVRYDGERDARVVPMRKVVPLRLDPSWFLHGQSADARSADDRSVSDGTRYC